VIRQIAQHEVLRPLEPIAEVASTLRDRLEALGVNFVEDDDPGLPSPSQTAAIELGDGTQFAFEHFYDYGERLIVVRARPGSVPPRRRLQDLQAELDFGDGDILAVAETW
jgi:hypothetical protein